MRRLALTLAAVVLVAVTLLALARPAYSAPIIESGGRICWWFLGLLWCRR